MEDSAEGGRGVTGKKTSFVDDTERCFSAEKDGIEEILRRLFFFPSLLKSLNIKNTDPRKRRKEGKNKEEHESHSRKEKNRRVENFVN